MWSNRSEQLANGHILKVSIDRDGSPISFADVLRRWQDDAAFRSYFMALLTESSFSAFRWETPPITTTSISRPFEFVLLDSPGLTGKADPFAFADYFGDQATNVDVVSFPNLGKDAILVVPTPRGEPAAYCHLATFVREAPESQRHSLWKRVGQVVEETLATEHMWLSTAGAGVSWLHVRLDKKPKYYGYRPYRDIT